LVSIFIMYSFLNFMVLVEHFSFHFAWFLIISDKLIF
jgi:hypothetical protein